MYIQLIKGRKWFWKIKDGYGDMVVVSQYYRTKWAAKRSARKLAKANDMQIRPYHPSSRTLAQG
jgi:hypothetical protein